MGKEKDISRTAWVDDITALFGTNIQVGIDFHALLKNLACHYILEQYKENPDRTEFDINVAPYGMSKLVKKDNSFIVEKFEVYPAFKATLINTIKTGESNLYREQYKRVLRTLRCQLNKYSEGGIV